MKNKKYWLLTSAVTLLPAVIGMFLWDRLPAMLPTHFGADGTVDGWSGKAFAVFGIPAMLLVLQWVLYFATLLDKQNRGHNRKVLDLVGLIFPAMSVAIGVVTYSLALGYQPNITRLMLPLLGLFFAVMGNWMPKVRQNSTLGVKLPWTLYNEENWNRTHRVAGYTWVVGGLIFLVLGFLPQSWINGLAPVVFLGMILIPTVYSWDLARRQKAAGTYTESAVSQARKKHPVIQAVSAVLILVILIAVGVIMFSGDIDYTLTEDTLVIEADYWDDLTVAYAAIDSVEYREDLRTGSRYYGFGSAKLMHGVFSNEELGIYTRYSYTACDACIVLRSGDDVLVLNAEDADATMELYLDLVEMIPAIA